MSREARLKRLGLYHLIDQPEQLRRELDRVAQNADRMDEIVDLMSDLERMMRELRRSGRKVPEDLLSRYQQLENELENLHKLLVRPASDRN